MLNAVSVVDAPVAVDQHTKRPRPVCTHPSGVDASDDENALDSQNSIGSTFWDSQGLTPTASPMKSNVATNTSPQLPAPLRTKPHQT